jgi:phosphoglycerol transferase MdoB-like AlkP superfamily enzyme
MSDTISYAAIILAVVAIIVAVVLVILFFVFRPSDPGMWSFSTVTPSNNSATINVANMTVFRVNSGSASTDNVSLSFNTGTDGSLFGVQNTGSGTLSYGNNDRTISTGTIQFFLQSNGSINPVIGAN